MGPAYSRSLRPTVCSCAGRWPWWSKSILKPQVGRTARTIHIIETRQRSRESGSEDRSIQVDTEWLEIRCARCKTPCDIAGMKPPPTTFVHDHANRVRCRKCAKAGQNRTIRTAARINSARLENSKIVRYRKKRAIRNDDE